MSSSPNNNATDPSTLVGRLRSLLLLDAASKSPNTPVSTLIGGSEIDARTQLRRLLTIRSPDTPLDDSTLNSIDQLLQRELQTKLITQAKEIDRCTTTTMDASSEPDSIASILSHISIYRGDITTLAVDAIVNAANSQLVGCFQPTHRCIDNVIHDAAGPRLRFACHQLMVAQGTEEPVGHAKITPAFNLPSKFVLHTVGPQIDRTKPNQKPTDEQRQQLRSCYTSCLDAASAQGEIVSIAFCCISTGLYGYPADDAAHVAVDTVIEWLRQHRDSKVQHIIFDVFLPEDERLYQAKIASLLRGTEEINASTSPTTIAAVAPSESATASSSSSSTTLALPPFIQSALAASVKIVSATRIPPLQNAHWHPEGVDPRDLHLALEWIKNADSILIAGGAGVSAAAGLDYTSTSVCKSLFPAMGQYNFRTLYQAIGKHDWDEELMWGYLFENIFISRWNWPSGQIYEQLHALTGRLPSDHSFVYTSNADGMFEQRGFSVDRIYTIQGDYSRLQCLTPCSPDSYWSSKSWVDQALPHIDPQTQRLDSKYIPRCLNCGGKVFLNVRGGDWFLEEQPHQSGRTAYRRWLTASIARATLEKPLVILEIGAGFNTPGVIRFPMERLATQHANVRLIRINAHYPQLPQAIDQGKRAIGLEGEATEIINWIHQQLIGNTQEQ